MPNSLDLWNRIPNAAKKIVLGGAIGMAFAIPIGYQKVVDIRVALAFGALGGGLIAWSTDWETARSVEEGRVQEVPQSPYARATENMIAAIAAQDPSSPEFHKLLDVSAIVMSGAAQAFNPIPAPPQVQASTPAVNVQEIFEEAVPEALESPWDVGTNVVPIQQKTRLQG